MVCLYKFPYITVRPVDNGIYQHFSRSIALLDCAPRFVIVIIENNAATPVMFKGRTISISRYRCRFSVEHGDCTLVISSVLAFRPANARHGDPSFAMAFFQIFATIPHYELCPQKWTFGHTKTDTYRFKEQFHRFETVMPETRYVDDVSH